ncbi:TetR/AcrR family transcriptional regulator [Burkholderia sp. MSMB1589WGS]|uniref:TetR/AcrR family transcriptional regulator n=1 Tax=Burkholderia sp. MSMB1589WGS TaxID=1636425 RepID=UPI0007B9089D|nr:TetR/AcrR family transcriptional regulator [Burkholderia sp. MSMB1589WGS]
MNHHSFSRVNPKKRSPRLEARLADNRAQILDAARRLVAEGGWQAAQMSSVAHAAGLATGSVYRYFPSKADLFAQVLAIVSQREVDVVRQIAAAGGLVRDRLADAVYAFSKRALRGRRLAFALIAEPCEPEIDVQRLAYRKALSEAVQRIIKEGIRSGEFPEQDARTSAACVVGAFMEALVGPLAPDEEHKTDQAEFLGHIVECCVRAVGARMPPRGSGAPLRIVGKPESD